jgi:hypothetical protein
MLSAKDLETLINLLNEQTTKNSNLNELATAFHKAFSKTEQFKLGCVLNILISDNLLKGPQRISGFFLLYELYKAEPITSNPFLPLFLDALESDLLSVAEKNFVIQLLTNPSKEVIDNFFSLKYYCKNICTCF